MGQLRLALEKEQEQWAQWSRHGGLQQGEDLVNVDERDGAVSWMCHMSNALGLAADTSALAAAILDRTLTTTRVQTKYLRVLALSAFYVACKICEEPEAVPPIPDLVRVAGCVCSVQELVRMERVLLKRLSWDLSLVTPYTFLELMLAISLPAEICPSLAQYLRPQLEKLVCNVELFQMYRPSLLAVALLSVTLERQRHPQWFVFTVNLQQLISTSLDKVIACREHLVECMWPRERLREQNTVGEQLATPMTTAEPLRVAMTFNDAEMKPLKQRAFEHVADGGNAENVCPYGSGSPSKMDGGGNSRKRQRRKSRCSDGSGGGRIKTAPEEIFIDEIYDAVHVLYGMEKYR